MQDGKLDRCQVSRLLRASASSGSVYVDSTNSVHHFRNQTKDVNVTSEYLELSGKVKLPFWIARVLSPKGRLKKQSL